MLKLIFARSANGVIGKGGSIPWHLPEDLAHFKACTQGCAVIMGRKTWDSLPPRFRPLPGRTNIVITRQTNWQSPGAHRAASLQDAIAQCDMTQAVWVIGGAQVYAQALPLADCVEVTELAQDFEGDAFSPELGPEWLASQRSTHIAANGMGFAFITYRRQVD